MRRCRRLRSIALLAATTSFLPLLSGCSPDLAQTTEASVPKLMRHVRGDRSALERPKAVPLGRVELYVDLSQSMQPYVSAGAALPRLLTHLDGALAGKMHLFGFGFLAGDTAQAITPTALGPLLQASAYTRLNNDYASLFGTFSDAASTRLIVSDGVQSDPTSGARFGDVVRAAQTHLARGGVFGALVLRGAYRGTYFAEGGACANTAVPYDCGDRPFVVYVFAPSKAAYDAVLAHLGSDFEPAFDVRAGAGAGVRVVPVEETMAPPGQARARGERVLANIDSVLLSGYFPVYTARLREKAASDHQGYAPLQFDLVPTPELARSLGKEGLTAFLSGMEADVRAWALTPARGDAPARVDSLGVPATLPATVKVRTEKGGVVARLTVPVRRPASALAAKTRTLAWAVTLRPGAAEAQRLIPAALSTSDDCAPTMCPRILNLRPMLGAVLNDSYVPGRVLLVTTWRPD